jgi:hypothetical protein
MTDIERLRDLHKKANPDSPFTSVDFIEDGWGLEFAEWMAESLNSLPSLLADYERLRGMEERVKGAAVAEIDSESSDFVKLIAVGSSLDNAITAARIDALHGQTVALVPVPGGE